MCPIQRMELNDVLLKSFSFHQKELDIHTAELKTWGCVQAAQHAKRPPSDEPKTLTSPSAREKLFPINGSTVSLRNRRYKAALPPPEISRDVSRLRLHFGRS